jgi:hypothetical protein
MEKNKNKIKSRTNNNYIEIEEILREKGLITKESIFKDIIENKAVKEVSKIILAIAFISGAIILSVTAPNIFAVLGNLGKILNRKQKIDKSQRQKMMKTIHNLRSRKLIEWDRQGDKIMLKITPRGRAVFLQKRMYELKIKKQQKWDKIWRVVIFDIPNNLGKKRDVFRQRLKNMGFFQFQKSAFIIPYPCQQELEATLEYYGLFDYITYLEATHISGGERCHQYFDL